MPQSRVECQGSALATGSIAALNTAEIMVILYGAPFSCYV